MYCRPTAPTPSKSDYMAAAETMADRFGLDTADIVPYNLGSTIYSDTFDDSAAYGTDALYVFVHDTQQTRLLSTEEIEDSLRNQRITAIEVFWYLGRTDDAPLMVRISEYAPVDETFTAFFATDRQTVDDLAHRLKTESHRPWLITHSNSTGERTSHSSLPVLAD